MDLKQRKLNKSEWESIEIPINEEEKSILNLIIKGFHNVNIKHNKHESILSNLKIDNSKEMEDYLFNKYFAERIKKLDLPFLNINKINSNPTIKKADVIRIQNYNSKLSQNNYENVIIQVIEDLVNSRLESKDINRENEAKDIWMKHYYTLYYLIKNDISFINSNIINISKKIIDEYKNEIEYYYIIKNAFSYIEQNDFLNTYSDFKLYDHQKEIFTIFKNPIPKLVLYIAPTGTGKTLTPLGLSENYRIIFVCAARHVGLALARSAISCNKKIAFAFGCESSADIRLHYFSVKEGVKNTRTGGFWKIDNSVGDKVEIMICDIKSYIPAMYYMMAFNNVNNIITYWDEPTITMDYEQHDFHNIIHNNWKENLIPNVVLCSATLPKIHELTETISDFKYKFSNSIVHNIVSHDCKKTIPLINKSGYVVLPHYISNNYQQILKIVEHCENYLTLLRYFDLKEVIDFICFIVKDTKNPDTQWIKPGSGCSIERYYTCLDDINIISIKLYYLKLLKNIVPEDWQTIHANFLNKRRKRIMENNLVDSKGTRITKSVSIGPGSVPPMSTQNTNTKNEGKPLMRMSSAPELFPKHENKNGENKKPEETNSAIYITTKDAFTLTNGPTIFLANDVEKIAKFCIQQSNIPAKVMDDITEKINYNNTINKKIEDIEKKIEDIQEANDKNTTVDISKCSGYSTEIKTKKKTDSLSKLNDLESGGGGSGNGGGLKDIRKLTTELEMLRSMIKVIKLNDTFVPNTQTHFNKWTENINIKNYFTSNIDDETIVKIMMLNNVDNSWKVLLLMGIGVFTNHESIEYTEIMKNLADRQCLYLIIASSDYVYGTNYQFCHGYLSKDINDTQEKIIQAMGRIGRNRLNQEYTIRFRDDEQIMKIFTSDVDKPEVQNMNKLFSSCVC
jgi:hypothetical protein